MSALDDDLIRQSAFARLDQLIAGRGVLTWDEIESGFPVPGLPQRVRFATRAKGIFKPKEMKTVLSIKTVMPRVGRKIWYTDQNEVHEHIFSETSSVRYSLRGSDPDSADNMLLAEAAAIKFLLIYFVPVAPAVYRPFYPVFVGAVDRGKLTAHVVFALPDYTNVSTMQIPATETAKRYALRIAKQRLHQAQFREAVIDAYNGRCVITGLPERRLLDASHIIPDSDNEWGLPVVKNGLPLTKIHHAAYDANLIGVDPDGRVHVAPRLLEIRDGPFFEYGIRLVEGVRIRSPADQNDRADRERLQQRFETFKSLA